MFSRVARRLFLTGGVLLALGVTVLVTTYAMEKGVFLWIFGAAPMVCIAGVLFLVLGELEALARPDRP